MNKNPKLKIGDRIILVYMPGENLDTGTKGVVKNIVSWAPSNNLPEYKYDMDWYDDEKIISNLSLLPETDSWLLDPNYTKLKVVESKKITDLDELISKVDRLKTFKKIELSKICNFFELERRLGTHNMYTEGGKFALTGSEYIKDYFKLKSYEFEFDKDKKKLIDKIIEMSEEIRSIFISKSLEILEKKQTETSISNIQKTMKNLLLVAKTLWMEDAGKYISKEIEEGLHDTSWQNDEGDKITLMDLLNATEDIPVERVSVEELKPHLLTWDSDEDEVKKIDSADLQYPILIFVDNNGEFISIIDGHHRAQRAVRKGLETIKAKVIPINDLPKDIRKVFSHMGRQEESEITEKWSEKYKKSINCNNPKGFSQRAHCQGRRKQSEMKEGELTEKCWTGYTQKGMKTMFGKKYPNCVKKTK